MKTVVLDIETIADQRAMTRCDYKDNPDTFAPWPLHELAAVSILSVEREGREGLRFDLESFSRREFGERGIVASVERAIADAHQIITFNGSAFDVPVLLARAVRTGEHAPTMARLRDHCRPGLHRDLHEEVRGSGPGIKLAHICAAFAIPAKFCGHGTKVADLAREARWRDIEHYCETDVVATWLATQMLDSADEPAFGRERWQELSRWITTCELTNPHLAAFRHVPEPLISCLSHAEEPAF